MHGISYCIMIVSGNTQQFDNALYAPSLITFNPRSINFHDHATFYMSLVVNIREVYRLLQWIRSDMRLDVVLRNSLHDFLQAWLSAHNRPDHRKILKHEVESVAFESINRQA
jgi:hypothetical protein